MGPLVASSLASGGASLLGGIIGNRSRGREAQKDRDFQSAEAGLSRDFTSAQAKKQMDFQQQMRSTEWQVGIEDMRAAGLNPALAYSQGGASSPGGASGSGAAGSGSTARQEDVISPAVASAMQYKRLKQELDNMKAIEKKTEAETSVIEGRWQSLLSGPFNWIKGGGIGNSARSIAQGMKESFERMRPRAKNQAPWQTLRMYYGKKPGGR